MGGSQTSRYRQINFGYGARSDFTLNNIDDKGDYTQDYENMCTLRKSLDVTKLKSTKKNDTFGANYNDKLIVARGKQHYYGKGTANHNGLGPADHDRIKELVRKSCPSVSETLANRGLHSPTKRQQQFESLGPGTYQSAREVRAAFPSKLSKMAPKLNGFGSASRDVHFG